MLRKGLFYVLSFWVMALWMGDEAHAGGKVVTLLENVTIPGNTTQEVPPLAVGNYRSLAILAVTDQGSVVTLETYYGSAPGVSSDVVTPKQLADSWVIAPSGVEPMSPAAVNESAFLVRGPYLLSRIFNANPNPATVTIKVYLTK